jgi:hypothetical protein
MDEQEQGQTGLTTIIACKAMLYFTINRGCITILLCRAPANRQNMAAVDATQVPATVLNTIGREPRAGSLQWITLPSGQLWVVMVRSGLCRATCITCAVPWPRSLTCDLCRPLARDSTWERDGPRAWQCLGTMHTCRRAPGEGWHCAFLPKCSGRAFILDSKRYFDTFTTIKSHKQAGSRPSCIAFYSRPASTESLMRHTNVP